MAQDRKTWVWIPALQCCDPLNLYTLVSILYSSINFSLIQLFVRAKWYAGWTVPEELAQNLEFKVEAENSSIQDLSKAVKQSFA